MKKTILLIVAAVVFVFNAQAQNSDYKSNIAVAGGFSLTGALFDVLDTAPDTISLNSSSPPAFQLTYDYSFAEWFSLGAAFSLQSLSTEVLDDLSNAELGAYNQQRMNFAIRPLFHYGNNSRLDMYSGLRIGLLRNNIDISSDDPDFNPDEFFADLESFSRPSFQIIAFGLRGFVTDNIGIGGEIAFGAPHIFNLSVNYRL